MEHITGGAETRSGDGSVESHMHMHVPGSDPPASGEARAGGKLSGGLRERFEDLGDRAGGLADQVREGMADRLDRARADLEERTGILATIRAKPLAAVGLAFSAGFVIAAVTARDHENWAIERARRQLRRVILSGVTAALAHELRGFLGGDEGLGTLLASFLDDDDDEYDLEA